MPVQYSNILPHHSFTHHYLLEINEIIVDTEGYFINFEIMHKVLEMVFNTNLIANVK
jgi:hypothetical protein